MRNIVLLLLSTFTLTSCTISTPKTGQKIGRIVKIADEGLFCKTCEGELIRGGLVDGSGSMGTSFHFTIESPYLQQLAYEVMEDQSEVIITYESEFISWLGRSESTEPHFVKDIQRVRK